MCKTHGFPCSIRLVCLDFLFVQFLAVYLAPCDDNVGKDDGDEEANVGHRGEGKLTGAGVGDGQGGLEVSGGGIVGCVVPSCGEK